MFAPILTVVAFVPVRVLFSGRAAVLLFMPVAMMFLGITMPLISVMVVLCAGRRGCS
jgi:hypothetical protein